MTDRDDTPLTPEEERRVAAGEYVLGLGTAEERTALTRRIETDPDFAAQIRFWEEHMSRFNAIYREVDAPEGVFERIEARLFGPGGKTKAPWYDSLAFWRGLAGVAAATAVLAVGLNLLSPAPRIATDTTQLVAALQPIESDVSFLARYESASGRLFVSGTGSPAGADADYELWFIEGEDAPISMGVVGLGESLTVAVEESLRDQFAAGITLAVTREVSGGSPTGDPEGPLVAAGPVTTI